MRLADDAPSHLDEYLDRVLIGGWESREITIVEYDPAWPARFAQERLRIAVLGSVAKRIEHIGSTAVPGLAAKPIIDILVTVDDVEDEACYVPRLQACGYVLRVREPDHRMLRTPARDVHVHVHVWRCGGDDERRQLLFRDWLRGNAPDRDLYEQTKRELARRSWADTNYYADAKSAVIVAILERAAGDAGTPLADGGEICLGRFVEAVVAHRTESESDIAQSLLADVQTFNNAGRRDDIAIVVGRFLS